MTLSSFLHHLYECLEGVQACRHEYVRRRYWFLFVPLLIGYGINLISTNIKLGKIHRSRFSLWIFFLSHSASLCLVSQNSTYFDECCSSLLILLCLYSLSFHSWNYVYWMLLRQWSSSRKRFSFFFVRVRIRELTTRVSTCPVYKYSRMLFF